ncbi:hypothetical protein NL676_015084 [Syzygium grande]|nr:hypothetical protein NL676_015084 [Syzygium grande]
MSTVSLGLGTRFCVMLMICKRCGPTLKRSEANRGDSDETSSSNQTDEDDRSSTLTIAPFLSSLILTWRNCQALACVCIGGIGVLIHSTLRDCKSGRLRGQ